MRKATVKRILSIMLSLLVGMSLAAGTVPAQVQAAGSKTLTMSAAKSLAVANSAKIDQLNTRLEKKQASLQQAVKSLALKEKKMRTFSWSPLLSFHLPEKPNLSEEYEFRYKPQEIQYEIDSISHQISDQKLTEYEKVSNYYIDIYVKEKSISFNEDRVAVMEQTLKKNRAKLLTGQAKQSDITSMEKDVKSLTNKITSDMRTLLSTKKKLSNAVGVDVTVGYRFGNPLEKAEIQRSDLEALNTYMLDRHQDYYEACMEATAAYLTLEGNYKLMRNHYSGAEMSYISSYVNQALQGQNIDKKAFKTAYDKFLTEVDKPWTGSYRIWFIRIPKEWFKGAVDGTRYVDEEPYALYEAALAYQEARIARENMAEELKTELEDGFNNYVSVRNTYMSYLDQVDTSEEQLKKNKVLNEMGQMTYEEYKTSADEYEELQNEMFEALATYTQTLFTLDRLTCGGVSALLSGTDADMMSAGGGNSYIVEETVEGARYFIRSIVQDNAFELGVEIPENFSVEITDYELFCDNVSIGKAKVGKTIRHLGIAKQEISDAKIRLYNGDEFVDDCEIDPESYGGPLTIVTTYRVEERDRDEIGTFMVTVDQSAGVAQFSVELTTTDKIGYYRIVTADGKLLSSGKLIDVKEKFKYLPILADSLEELKVEFYGTDQTLMYTGYLDEANRKIRKEPVDE